MNNAVKSTGYSGEGRQDSEENLKIDFCKNYFEKKFSYSFDVLKQVDILLKDVENNLLYIEAKLKIANERQHREALAQLILTNKKQTEVLNKVALIYRDKNNNDILELVDFSDDDAVMYNNDINWDNEKASHPSLDAIEKINDRLHNKITIYKNEEIKKFAENFQKGQSIINIDTKNCITTFEKWKRIVEFHEKIDNGILTVLFLVDLLKDTRYENSLNRNPLFYKDTQINKYKISQESIIYQSDNISFCYRFKDSEKHDQFWKKYKRPPEEKEFINIYESRGSFYPKEYKEKTGSVHTPPIFINLQNRILNEFYNLNEYIIFDPCSGIGDLEQKFNEEIKSQCFLSTLDQMDVDICNTKNFGDVQKYDYLENKNYHPIFKYKGLSLSVNEICEKEHKKLMIIMNPPFYNKKDMDFFQKCIKLKPDVIVFYTDTNRFWTEDIDVFLKSNYKIISHIISDAKKTFKVKKAWSVSQVVFDKNKGSILTKNNLKVERYEKNKEIFEKEQEHIYDISKTNLYDDLQDSIKNKKGGIVLGEYSYLNDVLMLTNKFDKKTSQLLTTENLELCLVSCGLIFNTNAKYFENNKVVFRGKIKDIPTELYNDAIIMGLFYIRCCVSNKYGHKNYIIPFSESDLGCKKNELNVEIESGFDFREFIAKFSFSNEAKNLLDAVLQIFKFYHNNPKYENKDWNDSFYDIKNAIMGKDPTKFTNRSKGKRYKGKTTKGSLGFSEKNIKFVIEPKNLPIFENYFNARNKLVEKIYKQLIDNGLLLWKPQNNT